MAEDMEFLAKIVRDLRENRMESYDSLMNGMVLDENPSVPAPDYDGMSRQQTEVEFFDKMFQSYAYNPCPIMLQNELVEALPHAMKPPMKQLDPQNMVTISEMLEGRTCQVYWDRFLLGRVCGPAVRFNAVYVMVEDINCHSIQLVLYNMVSIKEAQVISRCPAVMPFGTAVVVMHPWYKDAGSEATIVRCDNPEYVQLLDEDHPLLQQMQWKCPSYWQERLVADGLPALDDWPAMAKAFFGKALYYKALHCYNRLLDKDPTNPLMLANRAATYLRLRQPQLALEDAERGLYEDPKNVKLLYRKGKSLAMLGRLSEALVYLQDMIKKWGQNEHLIELLRRVECMQLEARDGIYDLRAMVKQVSLSPFLDDHADFISRAVEKRFIDGQDRLVALRDIERGELLLAVKAKMFHPAPIGSCRLRREQLRQLHVCVATNEICYAAKHDPQLRALTWRLRAAKDQGRPQPLEKPLDINRLRHVATTNCTAASYHFYGQYGIGLWTEYNYLTNACVDPNCQPFFLGDFYFVRAIRPIHRGDLLTICRLNAQSFRQRDSLLRYQSIVCQCRLCEADRKDPPDVADRLSDIIEQFYQNVNTGYQSDYLEKLLKQVESYRGDRSLNVAANLVRSALITKYISEHKPREVVNQLIQECADFWLHLNRLSDLIQFLIRLIDNSSFNYATLDVQWRKLLTKHGTFLCGVPELLMCLGSLDMSENAQEMLMRNILWI